MWWYQICSEEDLCLYISDKRGCGGASTGLIETEWERQDNTMGDSAALFVTQNGSRITSEQDEAAVTQQ